MLKNIFSVTLLLLATSLFGQTYFTDDFESGLGNWTNDAGNPEDFTIQGSYYNSGSSALRNSSSNNGTSTHIV